MQNQKTSLTGTSLSSFNSIMLENDEIYHTVSRKLGLSDACLWILYALRADGTGKESALLQSELCTILSLPKQTVNSALKKMENDGYILLKSLDKTRCKQVCLTQKGLDLARMTADRVINAENNTFAQLGEERRKMLLSLFQEYTLLLRKNMQTIERKETCVCEDSII